jgi:hypothetical protein
MPGKINTLSCPNESLANLNQEYLYREVSRNNRKAIYV